MGGRESELELIMGTRGENWQIGRAGEFWRMTRINWCLEVEVGILLIDMAVKVCISP